MQAYVQTRWKDLDLTEWVALFLPFATAIYLPLSDVLNPHLLQWVYSAENILKLKLLGSSKEYLVFKLQQNKTKQLL